MNGSSCCNVYCDTALTVTVVSTVSCRPVPAVTLPPVAKIIQQPVHDEMEVSASTLYIQDSIGNVKLHIRRVPDATAPPVALEKYPSRHALFHTRHVLNSSVVPRCSPRRCSRSPPATIFEVAGTQGGRRILSVTASCYWFAQLVYADHNGVLNRPDSLDIRQGPAA